MDFNTTITIYMIGEMFSAWALWACAIAMGVLMYLNKNGTDKGRALFTIIIIILIGIGLVLMLHALGESHAKEIRQIIQDAYKHPQLWQAKP